MRRRTFVTVLSSSVVALAGCSGGDESDQSAEGENDGANEEQSDEATGSGGSSYELDGELNAFSSYVSTNSVRGKLTKDALEFEIEAENRGENSLSITVSAGELLAEDGSEIASSTSVDEGSIFLEGGETGTFEGVVDFSSEEFKPEAADTFSLDAQTRQ